MMRTAAALLLLSLCSCASPTRHDYDRVPPPPSASFRVEDRLPRPDDGRKLSPGGSGVTPVGFTAGRPSDPTPRLVSVPETLTFDQAVDFALTNHPQLRVRQADVEVARAQLVTAGLLPNPDFVIQPTASLNGGPPDLFFRLGYPIPTAGKVGLRKQVARVGVGRAALRLDQETLQVLTDTSNAAVQTLYLQERLSLQSRFVELAGSVVKVQEARFKKGDIAERDLLLAQLDAAQVESSRIDLTGQLADTGLRLARSIGSPEPRSLRMTGQLVARPVPSLSLDQVVAVARQVRPDLAESRAAIDQGQRELALARALAVPDLTLQLRYRDTIDDPNDSLGVRFAFPLPIFDRNQGGIAQSRAQIVRAFAQLGVTELSTLGDIASAYTLLKTAQERLAFLTEKVLPLADRAEKAVRRSYEAGDINAPELSLQLRRLLEIRQEELEVRYLHVQLRTRLEIALGCSLAGLGEIGPPSSRPEALPLPRPHPPGVVR